MDIGKSRNCRCKNAFYLKSADGYLGLTDATTDGSIELKDTKDDACAFVYDAAAKQFKLAKEYNNTNAPKMQFWLMIQV